MLGRIGFFTVAGVVCVSAGKHHEEGKKHGSYGTGYIEEGGIVGYTCHAGWEPQGEGPGMVCLHKEKLPLLPTCPIGILEGDKCMLREPAIFSCPPGFVEIGNEGGKKHGGKKHGHGGHGGHGGKKDKHGGGPLCMKVDRIPFEAYCPMGTTLTSGQCLRMEIAPATMICPLDQYGGKKHGGGHEGKKHGGHEGKKHTYMQPACVETVDVAPIMTCPPNLHLQGGACIGVGEGPCPQPMPAPLILDGKKHKHGGGGMYRRLGEDFVEVDDLTESRDLGEETETENESEIEDEAEVGDFEESRGLGEEDTQDEVNLSVAQLPEAGKETETVEGVVRVLGEKKGGHHGHQDYGMPILPPVPSKMKMCTLEIIEPAIPICPPGSYEANGYDQHKHKKDKHGGYGMGGLICAQTVDIPLEPYCPMAGAILNVETMTCESRLFETELTRCPMGFEPCDMGEGKKSHKHEGKKHGHGGGFPGCCAVQYADPLPGCPVNAQLLGAQCVILHHPVFECPPGSIRDGEKCYIIETKPPKIHYQINVTTKQAAPFVESSHKKHKKHH